MNITFDETPEALVDGFGRMAQNRYIVRLTVSCGDDRCKYADTFDVELTEAHTTGLMVRNADFLGFDNPPFCSAFFAWDDIEKVHIY